MSSHDTDVFRDAMESDKDGYACVETSVKANDVFVVSSEKQTDSIREKPCAKPRCKKRRVSSSKGISTSSESVEDGECTKSDGEHEDGEVSEVEENTEETKTVPKDACIANSEQYFLRELRKMKADVEKIKSDKNSFDLRVKSIVKEVVAEEKGKWMKEVVDLVQNELKYVNNIEGQVYDITKTLKEVVGDKRDPTSRLTENRVSDEVLERMESVESQVIDLEARGRRNNLIIHGLDEEDGEDCRNVVNDFIHRGCHLDERVVIERVHRIGKRRTRTSRPTARPMIVKFLDYQEKQMVKAGAKHIPKGMYMTDDFPHAVRQARKELAGELAEAWKKGLDSYIRYPAVLVVGGIVKRTVQPVSELNTRNMHTERDSRADHSKNSYVARQNNNNNVNTESDPASDQNIPHVPWSTAGSRGKHRDIPERQYGDRHNTRDHFGRRAGRPGNQRGGQREGQRGDRDEQRDPDRPIPGQHRHFGGSGNTTGGFRRGAQVQEDQNRGRRDYRR